MGIAAVKGIIRCNSKNVTIPVKPIMATSYNVKLLDDRKWRIAIDQSSSCTGIVFRDIQKDFVIQLDIENLKSAQPSSKYQYYNELFAFIGKMVKNIEVDLIVCEKPFKGKGKEYTKAVLLELLGHLSGFILNNESLSHATFDKIYPQTWKSYVVNKKKGKNRHKVKRLIAEDLVDKYPYLRQYFDSYAGGDYDSFDALGILDGYEEYAFNSEGIPQIHGEKEKRHTSLIAYRYVDKDSVSFDSIVKVFGEAIDIFKPKFLAYNLEFDSYSNIRMASSNYDYCTVTIFPTSAIEDLRWKFNLELSKDKCIVAYIFNKSRISANDYNNLKKVLPMNEDVFGE